MSVSKDLPHMIGVLRNLCQALKVSKGSVLVYLIVVILIFGILGVTMVSLFTTATTSTATPNCARRCLYMLESAVRYAFSELRHNDFDLDTINNLNSTTYNVTDAGSFTINVFSPWFVSQSTLDQVSSPYTLKVPVGTLPEGFVVPANSNVWVINFEYLKDTDNTGSRAPITAYTRVDDTTAIFNLSGDFNVSTYERVALGVQPDNTQGPLAAGADLYVERVAKDFFPRFNGAININRFDYSYERLVDEPGNNRVKLENLTESRFNNLPGAFPLTVTKTTGGTYTGDFIVLSPRNLIVIPTATISLCSPPVSCGGDYDDGMNIFGRIPFPLPIPFPPDIDADEFTSNLRENETSSNFISVDTVADTLNIGGGVTGANAEFGAGWYEGSETIGGATNDACQAGKCLFGLGIRVFFVLKFLNGQQGDGFTFTLMNAEGSEPNPEPPPSDRLLNTINSVGGDFQLSELMGYAGDSRKEDDSFLDTTDPRGIQPPKLAIEFDTRTNSGSDDFCIDPINLQPNTRNDPLSNNEDAVQYVFWGDSALNVPCRSANPLASVDTYDDNRHGTTEPPINDKTKHITYRDELALSVTVDDFDDWLNGDTSKGPWAIRIEIEREEILDGSGNFDTSRYTIQTWIRQCATDVGSSNCTDESIIGIRNSFEQTRLKYDFPPERLEQQVELTEDDHNAFERFFFGFTGAAGSEALGSEELNAEISQFQLSFIRVDD